MVQVQGHKNKRKMTTLCGKYKVFSGDLLLNLFVKKLPITTNVVVKNLDPKNFVQFSGS